MLVRLVNMEKFQDYLDDQTIHGLKDLLAARTVRTKLLWLLALLFCVCVMFYQIFIISSTYIDTPTATKVIKQFRTHYDYPTILFCPSQWVNQTKVKEMNLSKSALEYAISFLSDIIYVQYESTIPPEEAKREFVEKVGQTDLSKFFLSVAFDALPMFTCEMCTWPLKKKFTTIGVCYQIRFKPLSALAIEWKEPRLTYIGVEEQEDDLKYSTTYGTIAVIVIGYHPNDTAVTNAITVSENITWMMKMKMSVYERVNHRQKPCYDPKVASVRRNYSKFMCMSDCEEQALGPSCWGCQYLGYFLEFRRNMSVPVCDMISEKSASGEVKCEIENNTKYLNCIADCPVDCVEWVYTTNVMKIGNKYMKEDLEPVKPNSVSIKFRLEISHGVSVFYEVETYEWHEFISNVGGLLGLWLGASVVSVFQLVQIICRTIWRHVKEKWLTNSKKATVLNLPV